MAKKSSARRRAPRIRRGDGAVASKSAASVDNPAYEILLRTRDSEVKITVHDRELYPHAVGLNRMFSGDQRRQPPNKEEDVEWGAFGLESICALAQRGGAAARDVRAFLRSAATTAAVQVEMDWQREEVGWAARVFPWEALISLAVRQWRETQGGHDDAQRLIVVRRLRLPGKLGAVAEGPFAWAVSAEAAAAGCDAEMERAAVAAAVAPLELADLPIEDARSLAACVGAAKPRMLHYVTTPFTEVERRSSRGAAEPELASLQRLAHDLAAHRPAFVACSSRHTGRRLAPLVVVNGARMAVGFHDQVNEGSVSVFFGAFYREWVRSGDPFRALRQGLDAHHETRCGRELGGVTLWSAVDLLDESARPPQPVRALRDESAALERRRIEPELVLDSLKISCTLEKSLNYSMLHNRRGGVFARFEVLKLKAGRLDDLEFHVKIDTGLDRPAESHFFAPLPVEADRILDFARSFSVPLGSELLRRRGEMLRGTVEVTVRCGERRVFHCFDSLELPPCDEWRDDAAGRRFLPSFVFPRDPAVREILSAAQPFLRALQDDVHASFQGYQVDTLEWQLRSIWVALQQNFRLDYSNPPPAYLRGVQRIRTPEEIVRARRGTCLELALLLASTWEHVGVHPVLFLVPGHAFCGFWASEAARDDFFDPRSLIGAVQDRSREVAQLKDDAALDADSFDAAKASGAGLLGSDAPWLLQGTHHRTLIYQALRAEQLVAVEATSVAAQLSFRAAIDEGRDRLLDALRSGRFDGMLDVRTARELGVTPLAIAVSGVVS